MAEGTAISWATHTFNPWIGCEKVSPGCAHCYAEKLVTERMGRPDAWGPEGVRQRTAVSTWKQPARWNRRAAENGIRERVFCASLADVFEPRPELEPWRRELFDLIEDTPSLDWLLLTKRPEEASGWLRSYYERWQPRDGNELLFGRPWTGRDDLGWGVLPNVWVGASIENSRWTGRADVLRQIPASVRFLSCEPLLGSLYLSGPTSGESPDAADALRQPDPGSIPGGSTRAPLDLTGIDWVIVGGESGGPASRPMHPDWAREIRDAVLGLACESCKALRDGGTRVTCHQQPAFHFKQWGSWALASGFGGRESTAFVAYDGTVTRPAAGTPVSESAPPDDLSHPYALMRYMGVGPGSGGKFLDGVTWQEVPGQ